MSPFGSILVSINSDAVGKDVGNGIILEIVIGVALPIRDGLCRNPQESAPPMVADNLGSYAPPLVGVRVVFNHRVAFIFVVVMANVKVVFQEQEGDESSASEGGMILYLLEKTVQKPSPNVSSPLHT
jgi:hypothetical protein